MVTEDGVSTGQSTTTSTYTMTTTIIADYLAEGMSRDAVIIKLATDHGMTINKATNEYAAYAKEAGLTSSVTSHKDAALESLATGYQPENWTAKAVKDAILDLVELYGVAESTARDYCKAYSKQLGVDHPVEDPRAAMFQYLVDHAPHMSYDELKAGFKAYAKDELGRSPSNINEYWKGYDLHLALMAAES